MSLQRVNLHHSSGGGSSPAPDNGYGGRRSSVRNFFAISSVIAVASAGLSLGVSPAQAVSIAITSSASGVANTEMQFTLAASNRPSANGECVAQIQAAEVNTGELLTDSVPVPTTGVFVMEGLSASSIYSFVITYADDGATACANTAPAINENDVSVITAQTADFLAFTTFTVETDEDVNTQLAVGLVAPADYGADAEAQFDGGGNTVVLVNNEEVTLPTTAGTGSAVDFSVDELSANATYDVEVVSLGADSNQYKGTALGIQTADYEILAALIVSPGLDDETLDVQFNVPAGSGLADGDAFGLLANGVEVVDDSISPLVVTASTIANFSFEGLAPGTSYLTQVTIEGTNAIQYRASAIGRTSGTAPVPPTPDPGPAPGPAPNGGGASSGGTTTPSTPTTAPVVPVTPVPAAKTPVQVVQGLTPTQVQGLSAGELAALPPAAFAVMTPAQVKALNPAQVSGFSAAQIQAIPAASLRAMKPATLKQFSVTQLRALTKAQASELRAKQINELGPVKRKIVNNKR